MKYAVPVAGALLFSAMSAQALETVLLNGFTFEPRGSLSDPYNDIPTNFITTILVDGSLPVPPPAGSYRGGGQMSGLLNGNSFASYCVEISIPVGFGTTYTDYNLLPGAAGFGARAATLASLMTWASAAGMPSNAAQSAALQAAVWEVVHETTVGAYSFTAGKLQTTSTNAATQAALNNIQTNWSTILATAPTYTVSRLDGTAQDLLIFAPIPEASTWVMMALGLAGVGAVARKRCAI
jgi:hypothetical protein